MVGSIDTKLTVEIVGAVGKDLPVGIFVTVEICWNSRNCRFSWNRWHGWICRFQLKLLLLHLAQWGLSRLLKLFRTVGIVGAVGTMGIVGTMGMLAQKGPSELWAQSGPLVLF
jgi:hypothetical protein